ncbi:MAG: NADH-quinone oxidoreductase subunit NuoH [Dehalococcoidia bacterium]|nr:NADH-quinone oxidoreductase subunit NuoH [Dehalococcoidia bacterium]
MQLADPGFNLSGQLTSQALAPDWPGGQWWHWLVFVSIILGFSLLMDVVFILFERRGVARFQLRPGPNRAGFEGILQAFADLFKALLKEDIVPAKADKWVHWLAPIIAAMPGMAVFAVVPLFGDGALLADLNVGILYVFAIGSVGMVGVFMAGWGSSNKYSLIAATRGIAQMVSYEIPLVLSLVGVVMVTGSMSLNTIVNSQSIPYILLQPLSAMVFFIAMTAEINRSPFDMLEAEGELIAGYHTEYSGIKFALFYVAEYGHAVVGSALFATFFLAGWKGPWLPPILWLIIKMLIVFFVGFWIRATLPRLRVDQLMGFAWKFLLPVAVINLFVIALQTLFWPEGLIWVLIFVNFAIMGVLILLWSKMFKLGGGRVEV